MPLIKATRAPEGSTASNTRAAVGTSALPIWPGITSGFNALCATCPWAVHNGVYQVKYANRMCTEHGGFRHG